jgi:hypothetical protein
LGKSVKFANGAITAHAAQPHVTMLLNIPDTNLDNQSIPDSDSDIEESAWEDDKQEEVKERKRKKTPQWEQQDYLSSKDAEYCDAVSKYLKHKLASKKEP